MTYEWQALPPIVHDEFDAYFPDRPDAYWVPTSHDGSRLVTLHPRGLVYGQIYRLKFYAASLDPDGGFTLRCGSKTQSFSKWENGIFYFTYKGEPIEFLNTTRFYWYEPFAILEIYAQVPESTHAINSTNYIALEIETNQVHSEFKLDISRLDADTLDEPKIPPNVFVLDSSRLDHDRLIYPAQEYQFTDISKHIHELQITRGISIEGVSLAAQVGSCTVTLLDAPDLRSLGIRYGCKLRVTNFLQRKRLFTGTVESAAIIPIKRKYRNIALTITAHDQVAALARIQRYGAISAAGPVSPEDRLRRLLSPHDIHYRINSDFNPQRATLTSTVYESTLVRHLDLVANSLAGIWYVDREGEIVFRDSKNKAAPKAHLSDIEKPSFVDAAAAWDSENIATSVALTNISAAKDEEGNWKSVEETYIALDPGGTWKAWGERETKVTTNLYSGAANLVRQLAAKAAEALTLSEVEINSLDLPDIASLDICDVLTTDFRGEEEKSFIKTISHNITPSFWHTRFELQRNNS